MKLYLNFKGFSAKNSQPVAELRLLYSAPTFGATNFPLQFEQQLDILKLPSFGYIVP